jgi:hypothetical protein
MAVWQGPALLAWNDATFSPGDFQAIAQIGQDGKMGQPAAIGRFGVVRGAAGCSLVRPPASSTALCSCRDLGVPWARHCPCRPPPVPEPAPASAASAAPAATNPRVSTRFTT